MRYIIIGIIALLLQGCSAWHVASKLIPSARPSIHASAHVGDNKAKVGGSHTSVKSNHGKVVGRDTHHAKTITINHTDTWMIILLFFGALCLGIGIMITPEDIYHKYVLKETKLWVKRGDNGRYRTKSG